MKKLKSKKGVALIAVYLVLTVLFIFVGVFINMSLSQSSSANFFKRQAQAFSLAEAGLDRAVYWLRSRGTPPSGTTTLNQVINPGRYDVAIVDLGFVGGPSLRRYKVTSVGTVGTVTQTLINNLESDNYARYQWFTDTENYSGTNVWFWSLDSLNGPVHTNGYFNIYGTPVFMDEVQSVAAYIHYFNNGHNINSSQLSNPPYDTPDFRGGAILGAQQINMPTQDLNLRAASTSGGKRFSGDTTVALKSNGTMDVTYYKVVAGKKGRTTTELVIENMPLPANGALFVDSGNLTVSGTLSGQLSVGASGDIIIPNNIVYANDPRPVGSTSTDVLGIVAEQDVVIPSSAPTNLEIDASIMALNTSFYLENWWTGSAKGTMTVYGGIIQKQRGPVGTFNAATATKLTGYSKAYTYDTRLLTNPPPFVPTTGDYIPLSWEN